MRHSGSMFHKFSNICTDSRHNIHEHECDDRDEENIENGDDDICGGIFGCKLVTSILSSFFSPIVHASSDILSRLEKYICTDKNDEEERQEIIQEICKHEENPIRDIFLEGTIRENERENSFEHRILEVGVGISGAGL